VAGRGVDEAGAGVVGDVVAVEQRHVEIRSRRRAPERMGAGERRRARRPETSARRSKPLDARLRMTSAASLSARMSLSPTFAQLSRRRRDLVEAVGDAA
jgi:hypothetical protein